MNGEERILLGLAAEYAVASELCRRGIYAQLTFGLPERTDLLVANATGNKMLRIQVKSKQGREWPNVKGIYGENMILVLVDFENKGENQRPDFYILTVEDWRALLFNRLRDKIESGEVVIDETNTPIWTKQNNVRGMGVLPEWITDHRERWNRITDRVMDD